MARLRPWLVAIALLVAAVVGWRWPAGRFAPRESRTGWVALTPAITETLFALGAGERLVAVAEHTDWPPQAVSLPRVGTSLRPHLERIAGLQPSRILVDAAQQTEAQKLAALGPVTQLPWLSVTEIAASIETLGQLASREEAAHALAERFRRELALPPPTQGPRVLLLVGIPDERLSSLWFLRRNSIHGAVLHAVGGRNAIDRDVHQAPRLSPEELVRLDPEAIVLWLSEDTSEAEGKDGIARFARLSTLRAVREGKVLTFGSPGSLIPSPRILDAVPKLRQALLAHGIPLLPPGGAP